MGAVGFFGVIFGPWWLPLLVMLLLSLRYPAWEVPLMALCIDLIWYASGAAPLPFVTLCAIAIVWALGPLRKQLLTR